MQRLMMKQTIFLFILLASFIALPHPAAAENEQGWLSHLLNGTGLLSRKPRSRSKAVTRRPRSSRPGRSQSAFTISSRKRAVCVRTCDGFYFPIAFGVTKRNAGKLAHVCRDRCSAPTKLYVHSVLETAQSMVTLDGSRYVDEEYANLYRTKRVANCDCNAKPWSQKARLRHKQYAIDAGVQSPPVPESRRVNVKYRSSPVSTASNTFRSYSSKLSR